MATVRPFTDAMRSYERWLGRGCRVNRSDLARKHAAMAEGAFPFLRATYFRWAEVFATTCPELARAPRVLAVGDLHVENFGSWRDGDGRLAWGINDFDEAYPLPFTNDLVRLATSCVLAGAVIRRMPQPDFVANALLDGYRGQLAAGGRPFVLAGEHQWLRKAALGKLKDPARFWARLGAARPATPGERTQYAACALAALPQPHGKVRLVHRIAGMGSLGRPRVVALAEWQGGPVAREAKALLPSANVWAEGGPVDAPTYIEQVLARAARSPDPTFRVTNNSIVRRLAPDGSRVEFADLGHLDDDERLIRAMGAETANIHLGSARGNALAAAEKSLPPGWLESALHRMLECTRRDRRQFRG